MIIKKDVANSLIYTLETIFSGMVSVLFFIVLANYLNTTELGVYSLAIVYSSILVGIANFGLASGYERNYFESEASNIEKVGSLLSSVQFFSIFSVVIFSTIAVYFKDFIAVNLLKNLNYSGLWITVLIALFGAEFSKFYLIYLRNSGQAKLYSFLHIAQVVINFSTTYFFLVILDKDVLWVGVSLMISHCSVLFLCLVHQLRLLPVIINWAIFREVLKISIPLTPRIFIGLMGTQFDKVIISILGSLDSGGVYALAQRVAMSVNMLMNALGRVYQPKLYKLMFKKADSMNVEFISVFMFASFIPALFVILFAKEIFLMFPSEYSSGYKILVILSFYCAILYVGKINGPQLLFAKKTWLLSGLSLVTVLLNGAITYPMVMHYGAVGAAAGTVVSQLLTGVIIFYFAQKYVPIQWNYKVLFFCHVYIASSACFIFYIDYLIFDYLLSLFLRSLILMIFFYFAYSLGVFKIGNVVKN